MRPWPDSGGYYSSDVIHILQRAGRKCKKTKHLGWTKKLKVMQEELNTKELVVLKSDKNNGCVILKKCDYVQKCNDYLRTADIVPVDIQQKKLIKRLADDFKTALKSIKEFFLRDFRSQSLCLSNPKLARLYGIPKIHRSNCPVRPIVSGVDTSCYNLAQILNKFLTGLKRSNPCHLKDSTEFVDKLTDLSSRQINCNNLKMASLDVVALYPSIPLEEVYPIVEELIVENRYSSALAKEVICLLCLVNNQIFFTFDGKIFQQTDGLAMGSPIAPILANLYM